MKRLLTFLYQWIFLAPVFIILTLITAIIVIVFSPVFGNKYWGYYPPKWWSRLTCWLSLCSVKSSGHENLDKDTSYVFIANHQGAFDIFLIYGFLNHNIKWMQKIGLRKLPFVGKASEIAGHHWQLQKNRCICRSGMQHWIRYSGFSQRWRPLPAKVALAAGADPQP